MGKCCGVPPLSQGAKRNENVKCIQMDKKDIFTDRCHLEASRTAVCSLPLCLPPPPPPQGPQCFQCTWPSVSSSSSRAGRRPRSWGTSEASCPCATSCARSNGKTTRTSTGSPRTWQLVATINKTSQGKTSTPTFHPNFYWPVTDEILKL